MQFKGRIQMTKLILLLLCLSGCLTLLEEDSQIVSQFTHSVTGSQWKNHEADIIKIFGQAHLSLSTDPKEIKQAKAVIYGNDDRVIVMLEVRLAQKKCKLSRNVVFIVKTGASFTVISPNVRKTLFRDCQVDEGNLQKIAVKINEREIMARIDQNHYHDNNVLGMDYMIANNVKFQMKANEFQSQVHFKFDTILDEEEL